MFNPDNPWDVLDDDKADKLEVDELQKDIPLDQKAKEAKQELRSSHPAFEPKIDGETVQSPSFLLGLTKWHPAIGTFQFLSDCLYPQSMPPNERFSATRDAHPWLFKTCLFIDFLVLLTVLLGLAAIATRIIYITIF